MRAIYCGDFNCRVDEKIDSKGELLLEYMENNGFCNINIQKPTYISRNGESLIDLIFTNKPTDLQEIAIEPTILRKHQKVTSTWRSSKAPSQVQKGLNKNIRKINTEKLGQELESSKLNYLIEAGKIDYAFNIIKDIIIGNLKDKKEIHKKDKTVV